MYPVCSQDLHCIDTEGGDTSEHLTYTTKAAYVERLCHDAKLNTPNKVLVPLHQILHIQMCCQHLGAHQALGRHPRQYFPLRLIIHKYYGSTNCNGYQKNLFRVILKKQGFWKILLEGSEKFWGNM